MEIRRVTSSSSPQSLPLRCKKQPCHYSLKKPPTPLRHPSSPNIHIPLPKLHNIQFPHAATLDFTGGVGAACTVYMSGECGLHSGSGFCLGLQL